MFSREFLELFQIMWLFCVKTSMRICVSLPTLVQQTYIEVMICDLSLDWIIPPAVPLISFSKLLHTIECYNDLNISAVKTGEHLDSHASLYESTCEMKLSLDVFHYLMKSASSIMKYCSHSGIWCCSILSDVDRGIRQGVIVELSNRGEGGHNYILVIINMINEVLCFEGPTPLVVWPGPNIWCYAPDCRNC